MTHTFLSLQTTQLKNVYAGIGHNQINQDKQFVDVIVPFMVQDITLNSQMTAR